MNITDNQDNTDPTDDMNADSVRTDDIKANPNGYCTRCAQVLFARREFNNCAARLSWKKPDQLWVIDKKMLARLKAQLDMALLTDCTCGKDVR